MISKQRLICVGYLMQVADSSSGEKYMECLCERPRLGKGRKKQLQDLHCSALQMGLLVDAQKLPLIPAKDAGKDLAKEPEKYDREVLPVKSHHSLLVFQPQIITIVHKENDPPYAPKVEQCNHQINWPQAVRQRWANEAANREKTFNQVFNQGQTFRNRKPEAKKGDHQESTEMESPPQCSVD